MVHLRDVSYSYRFPGALSLFEEILTPCPREMLANVRNVIMLIQVIFRMMQDTRIIEYLNLIMM